MLSIIWCFGFTSIMNNLLFRRYSSLLKSCNSFGEYASIMIGRLINAQRSMILLSNWLRGYISVRNSHSFYGWLCMYLIFFCFRGLTAMLVNRLFHWFSCMSFFPFVSVDILTVIHAHIESKFLKTHCKKGNSDYICLLWLFMNSEDLKIYQHLKF